MGFPDETTILGWPTGGLVVFWDHPNRRTSRYGRIHTYLGSLPGIDDQNGPTSQMRI